MNVKNPFLALFFGPVTIIYRYDPILTRKSKVRNTGLEIDLAQKGIVE